MDIKSQLNDLARARGYYESNPWLYGVYPTLGGFLWFLKDKKTELTEAGAILRPGRDTLIVQSVFAEFVAKRFKLGTPDAKAAKGEQVAA